jgi:hypothetical protein
MAYQNPNFDKKQYWKNRKAGMPGHYTEEQHKAMLKYRKVLAKKGAIGVGNE